MKQSLSVYRCKIRILPLFIVICLLALLLRLGFWQLSRAEEKREFLANQEEKMQKHSLFILLDGGLSHDDCAMGNRK